MGKLQLYCSWFCPFAQRAWIALEQKGAEYEYVEVDPYNKTKEFLAINPRGLIPVLVQDNKTVYESSVCIEYIDEAFQTGVSLLPKDPMDRAQVRMWCDFVSKRIVPPYYQMLQMQQKEQQDEAKDKLLQHLLTITKAMSPEGPFFTGQTFGMVDIMMIPHVIRFNVLKYYRDFQIPETKEFERFCIWKKACENHPSVKATLADNEKLIESYRRYAENTAKTQVADAIRKGGVMP